MNIAIITLSLHNNIGGILQAYALSEVLKNIGHEVIVLTTIVPWQKVPLNFVTNKINTLVTSSLYNTLKEKKFDCYVVGSDQIWRKAWKSYKCSFLIDINDIKKIAYGPSFGVINWQFSLNETNEIKHSLESFKAISVRELDMVDLILKNININTTHVCDPTLLLPKQHYLDLCKLIAKKSGIFSFILHPTTELDKKILNTIKNQSATQVLINKTSVEEWLAAFRDCDSVITDSYHCCLFSIIFNKPFLIVSDKWLDDPRFNTLDKLFNIKDRFGLDNVELLKTKPNINYDKFKNSSLQFLIGALK